jgi:hypothetical protein
MPQVEQVVLVGQVVLVERVGPMLLLEQRLVLENPLARQRNTS